MYFLELSKPPPSHVATLAPPVNLPAPGAFDGPFEPGDCNGDGNTIDSVSDAVFLLGFNFNRGARARCLAICDANVDGEVAGTVTDAIYMLSFYFLGGPSI